MGNHKENLGPLIFKHLVSFSHMLCDCKRQNISLTIPAFNIKMEFSDFLFNLLGELLR